MPCLLSGLAEPWIGIAAQQNVGAAAGHVGRNSDRGFAAGLREMWGFALVIFGVQHFMADA